MDLRALGVLGASADISTVAELEADVYDRSIRAWVPVMEPWVVETKLRGSYLTDPRVGGSPWVGHLSAHLAANSGINFTVTSSAVEEAAWGVALAEGVVKLVEAG